MEIGDTKFVSGCFTQEKFIAGKRLDEIERLIGYHPGRLSSGCLIFAFVQLPELNQFEVAGYSNVAAHRFMLSHNLDSERLKSNARTQWALTGMNRLVKVCPNTEHDVTLDLDVQYPHAYGVPQWKLKVPLLAKVAGMVLGYPGGMYRALTL